MLSTGAILAAPPITRHVTETLPSRIYKLDTADGLLAHVTRCVDPFDPAVATVRSIATCRAAIFGYDGQAFVCLRHEDAPPISPDPLLLMVEQRPDILVDYDLFDGWVPTVSTAQET